jgi:hypothetical protein
MMRRAVSADTLSLAASSAVVSIFSVELWCCGVLTGDKGNPFLKNFRGVVHPTDGGSFDRVSRFTGYGISLPACLHARPLTSCFGRRSFLVNISQRRGRVKPGVAPWPELWETVEHDDSKKACFPEIR